MIKHVVISGGSTTGVVMLGIFKELYESQYIDISIIRSIHATSVGTIVATILSLNYDWETVYKYIIERPWEKVININPFKVLESVTNKGFFSSYELSKKFFLPLFKAKDIEIDITLKQFYEKTNIELFFITVEVENLQVVELSHVKTRY